MLTPLDIHNKEFKKTMRGYEVDAVDDFLDEVIKDFESLYKDNLDLKEQLEVKKENLNRYKEMEETLQSTMVLAQKMAEEAKRNGDKEAELIIWEARKKAEQIIAGAEDQIAENSRRLESIRSYEKQLMIKLKTFLQTQLTTLDNDLIPVLAEKKESRKDVFIDGSGD